MKEKPYEKMMKAARKRTREMDAEDPCPPSACPLDVHIRTAMSAIESGIRCADFAVVADGQVLLEQLLERVPVTKAK